MSYLDLSLSRLPLFERSEDFEGFTTWEYPAFQLERYRYRSFWHVAIRRMMDTRSRQ